VQVPIMLVSLIAYILYGFIFYGGYRLLRHNVYARGGELPYMHPAAFLERYYESNLDNAASTPYERLQTWIKESEAAERQDQPVHIDECREKTADYPAKVWVCLGDSITHGRCSDDYVSRVRDEIGIKGWEIVNAGINGDTAWNMLQRLDQILACEPDAVSILAGTNDVSAAQSASMEASYRRAKSIPNSVTIDLDGYLNAMREIICTLKSADVQSIAVFTIPMIGENESDAINQTVRQYNAALMGLCSEEKVTMLDLNEAQHRIIHAMHQGEIPADDLHLHHIIRDRLAQFTQLNGYETKRVEREIKCAPWKRFVLMQQWNAISDGYGYYTLIDGMHLNDRGGKAAASLLVNWVKQIT